MFYSQRINIRKKKRSPLSRKGKNSFISIFSQLRELFHKEKDGVKIKSS